MVDPKPLLKGFGAAVDVAGQIATDKAINGRRQTSVSSQIERDEEASLSDNLSDGELIENYALADGTNQTTVPHSLGRVPRGAVVMLADYSDQDIAIRCIAVSASNVTILHSNVSPGSVTLWVT